MYFRAVPKVLQAISFSYLKKTKAFVGTGLFAFFRFGRALFTQPVLSCAAMGKMADRTDRRALANCTQESAC